MRNCSSAATSLPEALRLAPNLLVQRIDAHQYSVGARGFNGYETSNKLLGLIDGKANKIIAYELDISPRTVEIYRANLMDKLEVRSVAESVRIAFAAGMVPVYRV